MCKIKQMLLAILLLMQSASLYSQNLVVRKNIDDLTPIELATYEHAIQILKDRSAKNPYDTTGYAWQAWVHNKNRISIPNVNDFIKGDQGDRDYYDGLAKLAYNEDKYNYMHPGMCEHRKDLFLFWHRAEFYYFEKILQDTDPEGDKPDSKGNKYSTKNLAVPYWNFTRKSSGKRYPKAYERRGSVLNHNKRASGAITDPPYSAYQLAKFVSEENWEEFAGHRNAQGGESKQWGGDFETTMHDGIHYFYVGGQVRSNSMASPSTAAYDPIFFSFHSYVDYILEEWINRHSADSITSLDYFLRATQPSEYNLPGYIKGRGTRAHMGQVKLYLDSEKLGYKYEVGQDDKIKPAKEAVDLIKGLVHGKTKVSPTYQLSTHESSFEPVAENRAVTVRNIVLDRSNKDQITEIYDKKHPEGSFRVEVYLHPKKVKANIESERFRKRYFADWRSVWLDSGHAHGKSTIYIDLSEALEDLYKYADGEAYQITINEISY